MAIPRVFISSTCYDLKYIRENLKYFIKTLGYEPVLSEEGSVYYDPTLDAQDSCLREIPSCQMFVLIIGGRFGGTYKDTKDSITNNEYREAVKSKIPVFALVDNSVLSEYFVYQKNKANPKIDGDKIIYPSVDSTKIFNFIEEVRTNSVNNALNPFSDFAGIESYLRQQWAGMMFSFLTRQNEDRRVTDTLSALTQMSEKIEFLSTQILKSIGTDEANLMVDLYEVLKDELNKSYHFDLLLSIYKFKYDPRIILQYANLKDFIQSIFKSVKIERKPRDIQFQKIGGDFVINSNFYSDTNDEYLEMRKKLMNVLKSYNVSVADFITQLKDTNN